MKKVPIVVAILPLLLVLMGLILLGLGGGGRKGTASSDMARRNARGGISGNMTQPGSHEGNMPGSVEESGRPLVLVSPLYGLDELLDDYAREMYAAAEEDMDFAIMRKNWLDLRRAGGTRWGSQNWMRDPAYYHGLATEALVLECFGRPIFYVELGLFDDPRLGIESLLVFHDGFAELFRRDDLWQGILFLYADLTRRINLEARLEEIVTVSGHFDALEALYLHTPLRDQIRGREPLFLEANLDALRKYVWYLERYDPKQLGTDGSPGFFGEPCSLVKVALLLTAQIDPAKYAAARDRLGSTLWDETQDVDRLRNFLHVAIQLLE